MKTHLLTLSLLLASQASHALRIDPARCAADNLTQWTEGAPVAGTARGRNEWLKVCRPESYDAYFIGGNEFDELGSGRRLYVTFGILRGAAGNQTSFDYGDWRAPTVPPASMDDASCKVQSGYRIVGLCTSGCVAPDSAVSTTQGNIDIATMSAQGMSETLVPTQAESGVLRLDAMDVKRYIQDNADAVQDVLVIKTVSGGGVKVSKNHPLLNGEYKMAKAEELHVGDSLVTADGKKDLIVEISAEKYFGKLHNLTIKTNELQKSLYVVQGYISGDKKFQDVEATEYNRRMLREIAAESL